MTITITSKKTAVQAEGMYGTIKIVGNAEVSKNNVEYVSGSIYKTGETEKYIGSFNSNESLSLNIDNRDDSSMLGDIAAAVTVFIGELETEIQEGGTK